MSQCKYCSAEIIFIETPRGAAMPCDAIKIEVWRTPKGKKKAVTDKGEVIICETECQPYRSSEYAYISHFASCPGADKARRKGKW